MKFYSTLCLRYNISSTWFLDIRNQHYPRYEYLYGRTWLALQVLIIVQMLMYWKIRAQEHTYTYQHESILADLNQYNAKTLHLLIKMDDAIMYTCIWPFVWHINYKPLQFTYTSLAISRHLLTSQREKQWRIKGLTLVQWINLNQNYKDL